MITVNFSLDAAKRALDDDKAKLLTFCTEFIQDLNEAVVKATPVLTGNLRGSWYAGIGDADADNGPADPSGGGAVARMNIVTTDLKLGDIYVAKNGANYAGYVEYGTSRMSPRLFVTNTVAGADAIAEAVIARLAGE
jgi:HK97 gp10 family phage protein